MNPSNVDCLKKSLLSPESDSFFRKMYPSPQVKEDPSKTPITIESYIGKSLSTLQQDYPNNVIIVNFPPNKPRNLFFMTKRINVTTDDSNIITKIWLG